MIQAVGSDDPNFLTSEEKAKLRFVEKPEKGEEPDEEHDKPKKEKSFKLNPRYL